MVETCVHAGVGLPEWSALVVKGKEEESDRIEEEKRREDFVRVETERIRQQASAMGRRNGGNSRRESTTGSASGPPSPTQLKGEAAMMGVVKE